MRYMLGVVVLLIVGCRTMESVKSDRDGGTIKVYPGTTEEILSKAEEVFKQEGALDVAREGDAVFCSFPSTALHDGTFCGAWVTPEGDGKVKVRCVTKNRSPHIMACALTEKTFHDLLAQQVGK